MSRRSHGPKRPDRVAAQLREVLSQTLLVHSRDPALRRAVITDVRVSGDIQVAKVYYLALDDETPRAELEAAFRRSAGFLRTVVGQQLTLRHTPELRFFYDEGALRGRRIEALLREEGAADTDTDAGTDTDTADDAPGGDDTK